MNQIFSFDDLFPFGTLENGVLEIRESFTLLKEDISTQQCVLFAALACHIGQTPPSVHFTTTVKGQEAPLYDSHTYYMGKCSEYTLQNWKIPPLFLPGMKLGMHVEIPEGTVLKLRNFSAEVTSHRVDWHGGLRHNAHLGFWGIAPENTMPAFELAAMCGFPACIINPKVIQDDIFVCHHDTTINRTGRDVNGLPPAEPVDIRDMTLDNLQEWEFGSYKNEIYRGAKVPTLSAFFDLCARTGMRPMFSTHPPLTLDQWKAVRRMLEEKGILHNFHIKSFRLPQLEMAFSVFGHDIDGYTWDNHEWEDRKPAQLLHIGFDPTRCRLGIELKFNYYTKEMAQKIIDAGLFASAWAIERRHFSEYERLISYGVTEFTEDFHCSMGLNY